MDGPAPTLPQGRGFKLSIWQDLAPHERLLLLQDILISRPDLRLDGSVDTQRALEPLFTDSQGRHVSIAGEVVSDPTTGLAVDITAGQVAGVSAGALLLLGAVVVVVAVLLTR